MLIDQAKGRVDAELEKAKKTTKRLTNQVIQIN